MWCIEHAIACGKFRFRYTVNNVLGWMVDGVLDIGIGGGDSSDGGWD